MKYSRQEIHIHIRSDTKMAPRKLVEKQVASDSEDSDAPEQLSFSAAKASAKSGEEAAAKARKESRALQTAAVKRIDSKQIHIGSANDKFEATVDDLLPDDVLDLVSARAKQRDAQAKQIAASRKRARVELEPLVEIEGEEEVHTRGPAFKQVNANTRVKLLDVASSQGPSRKVPKLSKSIQQFRKSASASHTIASSSSSSSLSSSAQKNHKKNSTAGSSSKSRTVNALVFISKKQGRGAARTSRPSLAFGRTLAK
jgi:hypothetical protein